MLPRRATRSRMRESCRSSKASLRRASTSEDSEIRQLAWLPDKSHVIQHAPLEKASQVAHDVFGR